MWSFLIALRGQLEIIFFVLCNPLFPLFLKKLFFSKRILCFIYGRQRIFDLVSAVSESWILCRFFLGGVLHLYKGAVGLFYSHRWLGYSFGRESTPLQRCIRCILPLWPNLMGTLLPMMITVTRSLVCLFVI